MKRITLFFILGISLAVLASCGGAETKADHTDTLEKKSPERNGDERIPTSTNGPSAKPDSTVITVKTGPSDILANIDKHLVSTPNIPAIPAGSEGITNATISIENTLPDITFQKAIIEVSILLADGKEYRTDYYTLQNIEPGDVKTVRIPNTTRGVRLTSHVVKLRSDNLTNGEMVLVGSRFVPN